MTGRFCWSLIHLGQVCKEKLRDVHSVDKRTTTSACPGSWGLMHLTILSDWKRSISYAKKTLVNRAMSHTLFQKEVHQGKEAKEAS